MPTTARRQYRIEQLSAESGLSVDTIRYYQAKKLLNPPSKQGRLAIYSPDHLKKLKEIRSFAKDGFTLNQIRMLTNNTKDEADGLLQVLEQRILDKGDSSLFSREQLAAKSGLPEIFVDFAADEGLISPSQRDKNLFPVQALETLSRASDLINAGVDTTELMQLALKHNQNIQIVVKEAVRLFAKTIKSPSDESELLRKIQELIPVVVSLVGTHFHQALLQEAAAKARQQAQKKQGRAPVSKLRASKSQTPKPGAPKKKALKPKTPKKKTPAEKTQK